MRSLPSWPRAAAHALTAYRLEAYVAAVTTLGIAAMSFLAVRDARQWPLPWLPPSPATVVLALFTVGSELLPLRIERRGDVEEVTTSTAFAFAIVLLVGTAPAVYVLALASAVADVARHKPIRKVLFNVGQYALITSVAGAIFVALGGRPGARNVDIAPFLVAAGAFFCLNTLLTGVVVALSGDRRIVEHVRGDLVFNGTVAVTLLALSPVVALVANRSVGLLLTFLLPVAAVQLAAKGSLERARLIDRLRGSLSELTELNRAKDEFVAVVSHELRTPLTSVRGYIRTLEHLGADLSSEDVRACLEAADRQGERLQQLIERLLFVANIERGRDRLGSFHLVNVEDVVRGILGDMQPVLEDHRVVVHADEDVPIVSTHQGSVVQIVVNLLENAAKYSPAGSEIDVDVRRQGDAVVVSVRDRGPGIPREHWDRIFERFFQVDSSSTRAVGGTGLGLFIAASCAHDIRGSVWLERSDQRGSEFCVRIPSVPIDREARSADSDITVHASA